MKGYAPVMDEPGPQPRVLLADKGYDADFILADLDARDVVAVIPARRNRKVQPVIDGHIYALRNLVERCFSRLKHSRRLATRYDKTADSFLGFVLVASIRLWVRHLTIDALLTDAKLEPPTDYTLATSQEGYTTNVPVADLIGGKAMIATRFGGQPLQRDHGGPARLLVPHLYFWKSAKWIRSLQFTDRDEAGFWELRGYHIYGDPWEEQRFS